jgi:GGDEF domain-containing protein
MLGPSLTVMHLAIASVCTALMIGLGFLARPQRSTVLWSAVFAVAMAGAVGAMASATLDSRVSWLVSMALVLTLPAIVWSGLRAHRAADRSYAWMAPTLGVVVTVIFILGAGSPGFHVAGRVTMLIAAVFNVLVLQEIFRRPERGRGAAVPLVLASLLWMLLSVVGVIASILNIQENYELLTQTNAVGLAVYLICALVSLLFFVRGDGMSAVTTNGSAFRSVAADRLSRARVAGEQTWTLLDIRLDDPDDLRAASGDSTFADLSGHFHQIVRATFPAEADVAALSDTRAIVLLARTESAVRSLMSQLRDQLATTDDEAPIMLQLSASIGWAGAASADYDLDALMAAASSRAEQAVADGGDRWQRA